MKDTIPLEKIFRSDRVAGYRVGTSIYRSKEEGYMTDLELTSDLPKVTNWTEFFKRLRYKDNVRFDHQPPLGSGWDWLNIDATVEDTYNRGKQIRVRHRFSLPPFPEVGLKGAQEIIRSYIHSVECHEADEYMLFDGVMVFDPHKNESRRL